MAGDIFICVMGELNHIRLGDVVPHGIAYVNHVFQIAEVVNHPAAIFVNKVDTGWRVGVGLIDGERHRCALDVTEQVERLHLKLIE